jgi:hypothetical protein
VSELRIGDSVTGDFLRVALDADSGKLRHLGVIDDATRGALLIDLVRTGRLTPDGVPQSAATTTSGFALADELVHRMVEHPKQPMQVWLQRGIPHLHEFIAELLVDGDWTLERHGITATHARYVDRDAHHYDELRADLIEDIGGRRAPANPREAAVAALANVTGLGVPSPRLHPLPEHLRAACGELTWIVAEVTTFLYDFQADAGAAGTVSGVTTGISYGSV